MLPSFSYWVFVAYTFSSFVLPGLRSELEIQVVGVFEASMYSKFSKIFLKNLEGIELEEWNITVTGLPIDIKNETSSLGQLCDTLEGKEINVLLVLGDRRITASVGMVGGLVKIPVLGAQNNEFGYDAFQTYNPYFVGLNPSFRSFISALRYFFLSNQWLSVTVLLDDSLNGQTLKWDLQLLSNTIEVNVVNLPNDIESSEIFERLSEVSEYRSRVLLVYCDQMNVKEVFEHAVTLDMLNGEWVWILLDKSMPKDEDMIQNIPEGILGFKVKELDLEDKQVLKSATGILTTALKRTGRKMLTSDSIHQMKADKFNCWIEQPPEDLAPPSHYASILYREIRGRVEEVLDGSHRSSGPKNKVDKYLRATFELLNLVNNGSGYKNFRNVGNLTSDSLSLDTIIWPGGGIAGPIVGKQSEFRIVTTFSPPFIMETDVLPRRTCLKGIPCLLVNSNEKNAIIQIVTQYQAHLNEGVSYNVTCCYGYSIDLLVNIAAELKFEYTLYIVADGYFGSIKKGHWNGIMGDLVRGTAHMSFSPLSVTLQRANFIDYSVPYYYTGVSFIASSRYREVPLLAFLAPFSIDLWIGIFISLNVTALSVAIYEWLSPFGLNPWGRQRTKNFSIGSALWVMWGLLFSHLVAFKAPKSWPNKVLINVWGAFSVIFLASYTANIAALFAGLLFQTTVRNFNDRSLLTYRVGTSRSSAPEYYISKANNLLWHHVSKQLTTNIEEGVQKVRDGSLDLLAGDTAILDYYRGTDPGCTLRAIADESITEDTYAIGFHKDVPNMLKDALSAVIRKYSENGYMDQLQEKWYGPLPCFSMEGDHFKPQPLGVSAVAGVFIMLLVGMLIGFLILIFEHLFYKYALPLLRTKPKGTLWRSRNLMFFSQKLYRFINIVELVSPHHSAKELVNNLKTGQITSLFQKSIKKKENEQRRRRKSKAQFFEMIQEIRRVQRAERSAENTPSPQSTKNMIIGIDKRDLHDAGDSLMEIAIVNDTDDNDENGFSRKRVIVNEICERFSDLEICGPSGHCSRGNLPICVEGYYSEEVQQESLTSENSVTELILRIPAETSNPCQDHKIYQLPTPRRYISSPVQRKIKYTQEENSGSTAIRNFARVYSEDDTLQNDSTLSDISPIQAENESSSQTSGGSAESDEVTSYQKRPISPPDMYRNDPPTERESTSRSVPDLSITASQLERDRTRLHSLSKDQILGLWRSNENHWRHQLEQLLREKRALEMKLACIQNDIMDPP